MGRLAANDASSRNERSMGKLLLCMYYQVKYNFNIKNFNVKCYPMREIISSIPQEESLLNMLQKLGSLFLIWSVLLHSLNNPMQQIILLFSSVSLPLRSKIDTTCSHESHLECSKIKSKLRSMQPQQTDDKSF